MTLNTNRILTSAALAIMVGFGVAQSAKAEPIAQLMSQVPTPAEESAMDESSLTEIKATVVRVTNENAVRVRLENGGYKMVSLARSNRLGSLSRGDEIYITMRGDEVIGVSSEAGAYQQVATTTRSTTTRIESSQSSQSSQESAPTVQTETQVQPRPVPQAQQPAPAPAPAPEPAARPAPQPVRALW
jgi:translation initiation factor IF-1